MESIELGSNSAVPFINEMTLAEVTLESPFSHPQSLPDFGMRTKFSNPIKILSRMSGT